MGFLEILSATSCDSPAPPDAVSPGHNGERFVGRCQDTDGGLAVAQLCGDAVTVRLVQAKSLVVKCAEDAAANDPCRAIAIDFGRPSFPPRWLATLCSNGFLTVCVCRNTRAMAPDIGK